jgi:hypothetical protein
MTTARHTPLSTAPIVSKKEPTPCALCHTPTRARCPACGRSTCAMLPVMCGGSLMSSAITDLPTYVVEHTQRGECGCGLCIDRGNKPDPQHAVDNGFFKVALKNNPDIQTFLRLTLAHTGEFADVDPFDGKEHGYIELGAWIGDQGVALCYMALGHMLEAFTLMTPRSILGADTPDDLVQQMAGMGLVTVVARSDRATRQ